MMSDTFETKLIEVAEQMPFLNELMDHENESTITERLAQVIGIIVLCLSAISLIIEISVIIRVCRQKSFQFLRSMIYILIVCTFIEALDGVSILFRLYNMTNH